VRRLLVAIALAIALAPAAAIAQPGAPPPGPGLRRERIKERVIELRARKLTRALGLDDATAAKLFPVLARHDEQLARIARENAVLRREAEDAAARGDDAAANRAIDRMVANHRQRASLEEARFAEVRRILTPAQAVRFLVVLPAIDRRIHGQLRRAIEGRGPGPHMGREPRRGLREEGGRQDGTPGPRYHRRQ
jgi:hypothetical protein